MFLIARRQPSNHGGVEVKFWFIDDNDTVARSPCSSTKIPEDYFLLSRRKFIEIVARPGGKDRKLQLSGRSGGGSFETLSGNEFVEYAPKRPCEVCLGTRSTAGL